MPDFATEPKRFGPFPSQYNAGTQLINSGWTGHPQVEKFFAESGC